MVVTGLRVVYGSKVVFGFEVVCTLEVVVREVVFSVREEGVVKFLIEHPASSGLRQLLTRVLHSKPGGQGCKIAIPLEH